VSSLRQAVEEYLQLRRKLGSKLSDSGHHLHDFLAFLERQGASYITTEHAVRWAMLPAEAQPAHWAARLRSVRLFARHHSASDPRTEVPPLGLLPYRAHRKQPYLYSMTEVRRLMAATKNLHSTTGLRPWTYSTLLGLLVVTGLRVGEALRLDRDDVDWEQCTLTVRSSKFNKTRLVPVHPTTRDVLRRYARRRDRAFPRATTPSFFVSEWGTRLEHSCVSRTFYRLSRWVGLRGPTDHHGPRLHDFRHGFVVRTVLRWYRQGVAVEPRMPVLATYVGHGHVSDTYWYLSSVPELLRLAAARVDRSRGGSAHGNRG
jgi:integrase/recombinase XerD